MEVEGGGRGQVNSSMVDQINQQRGESTQPYRGYPSLACLVLGSQLRLRETKKSIFIIPGRPDSPTPDDRTELA
jgi:hypothetical protein